jgi:hypothetical protein
MTADENTAEKYDQDDGAQKIRAFSGKLESGFRPKMRQRKKC